MSVLVNGAPQELDPGTTVAALLASIVGTTRGSAVVVDGEVLPRAQWPDYKLHSGQSVEVITAVQGG
jgi:sulfur carrier protein